MPTERHDRPALTLVAEIAKALSTAALSLALGVVLCLLVLLACTALAAG